MVILDFYAGIVIGVLIGILIKVVLLKAKDVVDQKGEDFPSESL